MSLQVTTRCPLGHYLSPLIRQMNRSAYGAWKPIHKSYSSTALKCDKIAANQCEMREKQSQISTHLSELNDLFLHSYGIRKAEVKKDLGITTSVIILHRDNLILKHKGQTTIVKYVPDQYHLIKNIAHIACTLQTLQLLNDEQHSEKAAIKEKCLDRISSILELIKEDKTTPILEKYVPLLKEYLSLLEEKKETSLLCLEGPLKALLKDAAILRTDALHQQIKMVQAELSPNQWKNLAIIVMGPRMPREGELGMQYAKKMILETPDSSLAKLCPHLNGALTKTSHAFQGKRLIYVESIEDVDKALDELTTEICDEVLGEALLGDKNVMRADFLKDSVRDYLQTLAVKSNSKA